MKDHKPDCVCANCEDRRTMIVELGGALKVLILNTHNKNKPLTDGKIRGMAEAVQAMAATLFVTATYRKIDGESKVYRLVQAAFDGMAELLEE